MCGIIGCVSKGEPVADTLVSSLKRLEYRGYDSAGIAVLEADGFHTVREVGKISNLEKALREVSLSGTSGIGHTRWATHGRPTTENAHPHRDPEGQLTVVHNGIIENYLEIRRGLQAKGAHFSSETDSEVIAHLVAHHYRGDLSEAVRRALGELEGSYAVVVVHRDHPGLLVGARRDSPLVMGLDDDANYLASDVPAILPMTRRVVYLEDGEVAEVRHDGWRVVGLDGVEHPREETTISWSPQQAEKGGYPHYMLKEINEQPNTVSDCLLGRLVEDDSAVVFEGPGLELEPLRAIERVTILACGTSLHAGYVARFYLEHFAKIPVDVDYASEFAYRDPILDPAALVVGISQSGETADTRAALRKAAHSFGARTLVICNVAGSSMAREADALILTHAGPEIGVASTKAFTGQLTALLLFSLRLGQARGVLSSDQVREVCVELRRLPTHLEEVLRNSSKVREIAEIYHGARDFLYIGRGLNYPIALEGALKLKEISYIHAEGYPAGEMKHGPIALIDEDMPILALATHDARPTRPSPETSRKPRRAAAG